jgi:GTP-binding protein
MPNPLVAIVGRPNVGKSTLFNRLTESRDAIVSDIPGTTRDRLLRDVFWDDYRFTLVDTGGLEPRPQDPIREKVKAQVEVAVSEADLIIFLLDVADGLTPMDEEVADWLRRSKRPMVAVVNKVDNEKREISAAEFYELGMDEPVAISAYHNLGIYDLMDRVIPLLPPLDTEETEEGVLKLAIVGRTNVGKSMLMNSILGQERSIVSEIPGTTRDALDTRFTYGDRPVVLIDTAGIRRPGRVEKGIEYYSVLRSERAIQRCDIALMVMDASELATAQDAHLSGNAWDSYKGMIAVANKWDLVPKEDGTEQEFAIQTIRQRLHFMPYAPINFTSALMGEGIEDLMDMAVDLYDERMRWVHHRDLNHVLMGALAGHMPPSRHRKPLRIDEVRQADVNPPTFVFTVNNPNLVHFSYHRYLENQLRVAFGFTHTHLRLVFRRRR